MTMRRPAGSTTRRHRPSAAAIAYSHAQSLTENPYVAESIAAASLRRGAHSRLAVIAHARHQALGHARRSPLTDPKDSAESELRNLALQLAHSRPALERSIVDLELRYSLDPSSFARVLGLTNSRAIARSAAITQTWSELLDPAVMAWLGPGSCDELATMLTHARLWPRSADVPVISSIDSTGPIPLLSTGTEGIAADVQPKQSVTSPIVTVGALLEVAPAVRAHSLHCDICAERLRMLTPVRVMVGQTPIENVPESVAEAAKTAYRRIPTPLPPSIEPHRIDVSRLRIPAFTVAALAAAILVGVLIVKRDGGNEPSQADRVAKLVDAATPSSLLATPSIVTSTTKTASLANNADVMITWNISANVPWLAFDPTSGTLQPTQSVSIALKPNEPIDNRTDAAVTIVGSDGSRQVLQYSAAH